MLDFGWTELLLVAVVALFAAGPDDIPKILCELGKLMRRLQYLRFSLGNQLERFMQENAYDEIPAASPGTSDGEEGKSDD